MDCCDIAWILAIGYIIIVPTIVILTGIFVGYYFKSKLGKNKGIEMKPPPPKGTINKKKTKLTTDVRNKKKKKKRQKAK